MAAAAAAGLNIQSPSPDRVALGAARRSRAWDFLPRAAQLGPTTQQAWRLSLRTRMSAGPCRPTGSAACQANRRKFQLAWPPGS